MSIQHLSVPIALQTNTSACSIAVTSRSGGGVGAAGSSDGIASDDADADTVLIGIDFAVFKSNGVSQRAACRCRDSDPLRFSR
jgi:hypothetical protein